MYILGCLRSVVSSVLVLFSILLWGLALLFSVFILRSDKALVAVIKSWGRFFTFICGVKVELEGAENAKPGSLYLFTHRSHLDIPVFVGHVPVFCRFGAKSELFKIPFFASLMRVQKALKIERGQRDKVLPLYKAAGQIMINEGISYALAPEGGRSVGEALGAFKTGPFVFAIDAECDIIPVIMKDTGLIYPKNSLFINWGRWSSTVKMRILPAISAKNYNFETRAQLKKQVSDEMNRAWAEIGPKV